MNIEQVKYAQSKPWFVEAGYSVPGFGDDRYMVRVSWSEPNEFDPTMMATRFNIFSDFDELLGWESKHHG